MVSSHVLSSHLRSENSTVACAYAYRLLLHHKALAPGMLGSLMGGVTSSSMSMGAPEFTAGLSPKSPASSSDAYDPEEYNPANVPYCVERPLPDESAGCSSSFDDRSGFMDDAADEFLAGVVVPGTRPDTLLDSSSSVLLDVPVQVSLSLMVV